MQMKNTRGVQQEEVSEAADALLASGTRPTIERVRLHLGRGSPNTVAPMLETWFAGLGKRLGVAANDGGEGHMPAAAAQAFAKLWEAALLLAGKQAETNLAQERQALSISKMALTEREANLAQREQSLTLRLEMANQLHQAEREKTAAAEAKFVSIQQQLLLRDSTASELRTALATVQGQLQAARDRSDALEKRHSEERAKFEERAAGNERRLLGEIDRERQTAKEANAAAEETTSKLQSLRTDMESRTVTLGQKLHVCEMELANSRHALALSEGRATELSNQLEEQRAKTAALNEQLNHALSAISRTATSSKRKVAGEKSAGKS